MHRARTHTLRFAVVSLLCILAAWPAAAQVTAVTVKKNWEYVQTGPSTVVANPTSNAFGFGADVDGINIGGIPAPTVSGPINAGALGAFHNNGVLVYRPGDSGWRYGLNADDFGTSTIANLDALFGGGTYTFTVNGATFGLNLMGYLFPSPPPTMTLTGGTWSNGRYVIDPSQALTVTTSAFNGYGTHAEDLICMAIVGGAFKLPFEEIGPYGCQWANVHQSSSSNPSNTASFTIPAGSLQNGQEYFVFTSFETYVDKKTHPSLPGATLAAGYEVSTFVTVKAESAVFPMTVTGTTGPPTASLNATFSLRPQDQGTPQNVYVFAVAPVTVTLPLLKSSADDEPLVLGYAKAPADGRFGRSKADTSVACVLAQLNGAGKLQQVSVSGLQAFVTGVLGSQSQSVSIVNGIATVTIGGATLYLSYGGSPQSMLQQGNNRPVATIPASAECRPAPPQTGWWWNKAESGRGYSIETQGKTMFYAAYLYDDAGRSQWYVATGPTSIDGSYFTSDLLKITGGQTLGGAYKPAGAPQASGTLSLAFTDPGKGTMVWPGGVVPIERFNFSGGLGPDSPKRTNQPEAGWWWNPQEGGRGFFLEWQGDVADIATYMYDDAGNPVWYLSLFPAPNVQAFSGNWWLYANGQSLTGAFKPATRINDNVAPVTIQFTSATTATMTLPNGRTTALQRFRFAAP